MICSKTLPALKNVAPSTPRTAVLSFSVFLYTCSVICPFPFLVHFLFLPLLTFPFETTVPTQQATKTFSPSFVMLVHG